MALSRPVRTSAFETKSSGEETDRSIEPEIEMPRLSRVVVAVVTVAVVTVVVAVRVTATKAP
jgi:hypothetical protein